MVQPTETHIELPVSKTRTDITEPACGRVFALDELVAQILDSFDVEEPNQAWSGIIGQAGPRKVHGSNLRALIQTRRVCKKWDEMITHSRLLRRHLLFEPDKDNRSWTVKITPTGQVKPTLRIDYPGRPLLNPLLETVFP